LGVFRESALGGGPRDRGIREPGAKEEGGKGRQVGRRRCQRGWSLPRDDKAGWGGHVSTWCVCGKRVRSSEDGMWPTG